MRHAALGLLLLTLVSCGKADAGPTQQLSALGTVEVTARLVEIRGEFPPNKLYDYVYVMKYKVLKVHRGRVEGDEIRVGHYNPLKPREEARDKFQKEIYGNLRKFQAGDVHRMALDAPLDDQIMCGKIDKYFQEKGVRYWAICTDLAKN